MQTASNLQKTHRDDIHVLRELAKRHVEISSREIQNERRLLWRRHNSLEQTRPMVLCLWWADIKEIIEPQLTCLDPFYRGHERELRTRIFQDYTEDDFVIEPWITLRAVPASGSYDWGMDPKIVRSSESGGAVRYEPVIRELRDAEKLTKPRHLIDEAATQRDFERLQDAIGDIMTINISRAPGMGGSIANLLSKLRGHDQIMLDMYDNPDWLHGILAFMRDAVLAVHEAAEKAGDWGAADHPHFVPYEPTLETPRTNQRCVPRSKLFGWFEAQELTAVSPAMHEEFMLRYQIPIMEKFGLSHYGCCEDLTNKISILRKVHNLRRIAVTPWANLKKCVEQIGTDYIISWQPNPTNMCCHGFEPAKIRSAIKEAAMIARGCHLDIVLKDVQTVEGHPERLRDWCRIVREACEECRTG